MIKLLSLLKEMGETAPYPVNPERSTDNVKYFNTDSGLLYTVVLDIDSKNHPKYGTLPDELEKLIQPNDKILDVSFYAVRKNDLDDDVYTDDRSTNEGLKELFKVMATVAEITKQFINTHSVDWLYFFPADDRRKKLYIGYLKKQWPASNIVEYVDEDGYDNVFIKI